MEILCIYYILIQIHGEKNGETNYILKLSGIQLIKDVMEKIIDYINEIVRIPMKSFKMLNRLSVNCSI